MENRNREVARRNLIEAQQHLAVAADRLARLGDALGAKAITDVQYTLSRAMKTTSQMDIPVPTSDTIRQFKAVKEE